MSGQWDNNRVPSYPPPSPNGNYNSGSYAPVNNQYYPPAPNQFNTPNYPPNYPPPAPNQFNTPNYPPNQFNTPNGYGSNQFNTNNYPVPNYPPPNTPPNNYNSGSYSVPQYPPQFSYPPPSNYAPPVPQSPQVPDIKVSDENKYRSTWVAPVANPPAKQFNIGDRKQTTQMLSVPSPVSEKEDEDDEDEIEYESSSEDEEIGKKVERKKSGLFSSSSLAKKRSPAYLLANGPLRVCGPCMAGIYCGDLPFPDGKKPKKKKMEEMVSQETSKVKEKQKAEKKASREQEKQLKNVEKERKKLEKEALKKTKDNAKDKEKNVEDEDNGNLNEEEEITIDSIIEEQLSQKISYDIAERDKLKVLLENTDPQSPEYAKLKDELEEKELFIQVLFSAAGCDGESTAINPLLRRRDVKKSRRTRGLVKGAVITTSTTSVGVVGGAIVGGVTGFLFGFGIPGMVVGAAVGAGIGGTGGASVGLYASHSQMTKKPIHCVNCKVKFKKSTPGQIPYRCRSCWLYFCDKCVPHELNMETKTFRTITYADDPSVLRTTNPDYEPEELFDELHIPLTHQQNKSKYRSKIKSKKLEDVSQVSKASKERKAYCSWCFQETVHILAEKGHITRNIWSCQNCLQRTLRCRNPTCSAMTRGLVGYDEEACWKCQKKIDSWETAKLNVENLVRNGYCSWCFEFTEHDPVCDSAVIKIFKCRNCRNTTVPCSSCPKGDGFGMARDNGFFWKGKCALHSKHIEQWEDIEGNKLRSELRAVWCPYCVAQTTHIIMGPGGLLNRKTAFLCRGCHQRTYRCDNKCQDSMAKHAKKKCLRCFLEKRIMDKKPDTPTFEELLEKKEQIYKENSGRDVIRANLQRNSFNKEKKKATKEGYLRPFLLLVSMEPQMRVLTAATLGIDIIRRKMFGDPHAEAWEIISHHNKGIIFRTRVATEEVSKVAGSRTTWYTSLRRSMRATMKTTTFKHISPSMTKEACKNPDINILPEMELEFLEKFGHWQHMMVTQEIHQMADQIMENKDFQNSMIPLDALGLATPPIKRLLAEMFAEAQFSSDLQDDIINDTDDIVVSTPSISSNTSEARAEFKNKVKHGIGSTYERKAKVVNWTAVTIPAAYVKLTVWFVVGSALALWLGPVGWAIEWGASLALGAVITAWICGEVYLGPSHEEMTPSIVLICMQRLTLAAEGTDITEFMRDEDYDFEDEEVRIQEMK